MKRSLSAPCLAEENDSKRIKADENQNSPNTREYLQLALARVLELQRQIREDTYISDNTSDLGDSETEEDLMKEVVKKVFKDLPGSSKSVSSIINNVIKPRHPELDVVRSKSIQLSGYDMCRSVAVNFMKNVVKFTPKTVNNLSPFRLGMYPRADIRTVGYRTELIQNEIASQFTSNRRRETLSSDYEIRARMLKSLDLHLAIKQRDYTAKLMRQ